MSGQQSNSNGFSSSIANMLSSGGSNNSFNQSLANKKQLNNLYGAAQNVFNNGQPQLNATAGQVGQFINGINGQAVPAWQQQLQGGAYQGTNVNNLLGSLNNSMNQGIYNNPYLDQSLANTMNQSGVQDNNLMNSLGQSMQQPNAQASDTLTNSLNNSLNRQFTPSGPTNTQNIYGQIMGGSGNNYADAMKGQYLADANNAQQQMLANLDARAAGEGMSGSSRHGVAEGLGIQGINRNLQEQLAKTGYETFDKDLGNKLNIAQMADTNALNREGMYLNNQAQAQQLGFNELQNLRGQQYGNLTNSQGLSSQNLLGQLGLNSQQLMNAQGLGLQSLLGQQGLQYGDRSGAQNMYSGLVGGQQSVMDQGLNNSSNMQNLGMGSFAPLSQQWSGLQNYASALGGPIILNQGTGSSWNNMSGNNTSASSMNSKSGGGGI